MIARVARRPLALAVLGAPSAACGGDADPLGANDAAQPHIASASCPLRTPRDWQQFLEVTVEDEHWVETCSVGDCDERFGGFHERLRTDVFEVLDACAGDIADNPGIAGCTDRVRRFAAAWVRQHARGSYGFAQENAAYLAAQTVPELPAGMMDPPAEILAALPERARVEEAARAGGWPYLTHDSALGGVRTFVTVADPEDRFEQWFLVTLEADAARVADVSAFSFIAVQKKDAGGRNLDRVRLHFRDYLVVQAEDSWQLLLPELHDGKCYACHVSGMRLLVPTHGTVVASAPVRGEPGYGGEVPADFGFDRLSSLNQRLLSYGPPDWNGSVEPRDHGPALGASLGCTECHDGVSRGILSVSTDERVLERKMVDELSMGAFAPGKSVPDTEAISLLDRTATGAPPLTAEETAALERARAQHSADHRAFVGERFPAWKAWALEQRCDR